MFLRRHLSVFCEFGIRLFPISPVRPFAVSPRRPFGVIGVAPVHGAVLTVDTWTHGGNLDVQEITTGNSVSLRVYKVVNPKYTYICKVNKSILSGYFG